MTGPALRRTGLWEALIRTTRKPFLRHVLGPVPSTPRDPSSDTHSLPLDTESPWLPQETPPDEGQSWAALCPNSWHPQGQGVLPTAWGGGHGKPECFLRTAQGPTVWSRAAGSRGTWWRCGAGPEDGGHVPEPGGRPLEERAVASPPSSRGPCPFHGEGDGGLDRRRLRGGAQPRASLTSPGSCCGATGPATRSPSYFQQDTAPVCFPVHSHRQTARQESRCRSRTWRRLSPPLTRRPRASGLPRHATEASAAAILSLAFQMRKKARGAERLAPSHLGNDSAAI